YLFVINQVLLVQTYASEEIACHAHVENTISAACEDVDAGLFRMTWGQHQTDRSKLRPACVDPRLRVQSRRIGDELCGGPIVEALETCVIVAVDEVVDEGVALDVGMEFVFALVPGDAGFGP